MFIIMKQRKGPNGHRRWMEVSDEGFSGENRVPLDEKATRETQLDPVYEYAVFEKLESPT